MDYPLVSVIMPAYNAAKYIDEAVLSVIKQTYTHWELIIIDDGSTDETKNIGLNYQLKDNRIKYFYQKNEKQGKARNFGISKSEGDYIAFLDADDIWMKQKLEVQINYLRMNPNISLIFSKGYIKYSDHITNFEIEVRKEWSKADIPFMIENNRIPILSVVVKRYALLNVGGFSESIHIQNVEDYHLWLKLLSHEYNFMSIKEKLFEYRIHEQQVTQNNTKVELSIIEIFRDLKESYWSNKYDKDILLRIKWFLFNDKNRHSTERLAHTIFKEQNSCRGIIFMLASKLPPLKFRNKVLFKLCY